MFAIDLVTLDGKDLRTHQLMECKQELRRLLARAPVDCPVRYVDHVDGSGIALFARVCKLDLEGIVASTNSVLKKKTARRARGSKYLSRNYRQKVRREELSERDRRNRLLVGTVALRLVGCRNNSAQGSFTLAARE